MKRLVAMFAIVAIQVLALSVVTFAQDSNIGTWKLNVAKSRFSPGPEPKSQTLTDQAWGGKNALRQDVNHVIVYDKE